MRGSEACCKVEAGCAQAANFNRLKSSVWCGRHMGGMAVVTFLVAHLF